MELTVRADQVQVGDKIDGKRVTGSLTVLRGGWTIELDNDTQNHMNAWWPVPVEREVLIPVTVLLTPEELEDPMVPSFTKYALACRAALEATR